MHREIMFSDIGAKQRIFECCGVSDASDYVEIFNNSETWTNIVPESCCNLPMLRSQGIDCSEVAANVLADDLDANRIYNQGCVEAVVSKVTLSYVVAGIVSAAFFAILVENLLLGCIVSLYLGST